MAQQLTCPARTAGAQCLRYINNTLLHLSPSAFLISFNDLVAICETAAKSATDPTRKKALAIFYVDRYASIQIGESEDISNHARSIHR